MSKNPKIDPWSINFMGNRIQKSKPEYRWNNAFKKGTLC